MGDRERDGEGEGKEEEEKCFAVSSARLQQEEGILLSISAHILTFQLLKKVCVCVCVCVCCIYDLIAPVLSPDIKTKNCNPKPLGFN